MPDQVDIKVKFEEALKKLYHNDYSLLRERVVNGQSFSGWDFIWQIVWRIMDLMSIVNITKTAIDQKLYGEDDSIILILSSINEKATKAIF